MYSAMTLDINFSIILKKIIKSEKSSNLMFNYLKKLKKKERLDDIVVIFLIKSILVIVSYYPHKVKKLLDFFKVLNETNSESKRDLINCLKKVVDFEDYIIGDSLDSRNSIDYYLDKIIFKTFQFIDLVMEINEGLIITLLGEIAINIIKIKSIDLSLKMGIFLMYIKDSTDIIQKNKNGKVYLKIVEVCGSTTRAINNYLS
tara:strand:- start:3 stop:608 length:606 start_codon:yes stop_codon:yes gene_type:complete